MYCPNEDCPDVKQTGSPGEYRDEVARCPRCGSDLVEDLPAWVEKEEDAAPGDVSYDFEALVPLCNVSNRARIPLIRSLLDPSGIRYYIRNERTLDRLPVLGAAVVLVEPSRIDEARELLSRLELAV